MGVQGLVVEVMEPDATNLAAASLHQLQRPLQVLALTIVEGAKVLTDLCNHARGRGKVNAFPAGEATVVLLHVLQEGPGLGPAGVAVGETLKLYLGFTAAVNGDIAVEEVDHHIRLQGLLGLLSADAASDGQVQDTVHLLQLLGCLLAHKVLDGGSESREVCQIGALGARALLEAVLYVRSDPFLRRGCGREDAPCVTVWFEAPDVPAVLLHEEAMENVAHGLVFKAVIRVLWEGGVHRLQAVLDRIKPVLADVACKLRRDTPVNILPAQRLELQELLGSDPAEHDANQHHSAVRRGA
mmetsp:Transcript_111505/g.310501  ORF Transcript_111505/g.310501 Transcript_111505/m.310501 type:complete len:298 (+) Transcript_111505:1025-1918(+)